MVLQAGGGIPGADRLRDAALRQIGSGSCGDAGACSDLRKRIADNHDLLRPEGLHARQGDFDIGVARDGLLDEAIEFPIMEGVPPAEDFGLRQFVLGNDGLPGRSVGDGHRDF